MYKVSVIIPIYNAKKSLETCIESVINQSMGFENIELILVDDKSNDGTHKIIEEYSMKYPNIMPIYNTTNSGSPNMPRNLGIRNATSKYVMFMDNDDTFDEFICEKLYDAITLYNVPIAMCKYNVIENGVNISNKDYNMDNYSEYNLVNPKENDNIFYDMYIWNKIYDVNFLREFEIYFPYNILGEDNYFIFKSYLNCDELVFINNYSGYNYNVNDSSLSHTISISFLNKVLDGCKELSIIGKNDPYYLNKLMKQHLVTVISGTCTVDCSYDEKIKFLEELYDFEMGLGHIELNQSWANIINKNIMKRNFKRAIYLGKVINTLRSSSFLTNMYRKIYNI